MLTSTRPSSQKAPRGGRVQAVHQVVIVAITAGLGSDRNSTRLSG